MARSSRKRRRRRNRRTDPAATAGVAPAREAAPPETRPARRARGGRDPTDAPPPAPWGSFPMVELVTLIGIVMLVAGFVVGGSSRGPILIVAGIAIASLAGLELAIREHLAGYRSHTLVLAGVPAVIVLGVFFVAAPDALSPALRIAIAAAVFAVFALALARLFTRRSGGRAFKLKGFRG